MVLGGGVEPPVGDDGVAAVDELVVVVAAAVVSEVLVVATLRWCSWHFHSVDSCDRCRTAECRWQQE